ncbi:MAG: hypothetical protein Tsb0016_18610 [Sphingomonadales bacterium]
MQASATGSTLRLARGTPGTHEKPAKSRIMNSRVFDTLRQTGAQPIKCLCLFDIEVGGDNGAGIDLA